MASYNLLDIGLVNRLLPDGTKLLPEVQNQCLLIVSKVQLDIRLMEISQQVYLLSITEISFKISFIEISLKSPRGQWLIKWL